MEDKKFVEIVESINPANMKMFFKSILIPPEVMEGEEWKEKIPSLAINVADGVTLPLVLGVQCIYCNMTEQEESTLEQLTISNFQTVVISASEIGIGPKDSQEYLMQHFLWQKDAQVFLPLWQKTQMVCTEFRLYIGDASSLKIDKREVVAKPPSLLFACGGVWDGQGQSWMFEPFSQSSEIWPQLNIMNEL